MKRILAVIRPEKQKMVEEALKDAGVPGVTISKVVGFGEESNLFRSDWHMAHVRLVVYANDDEVNRICKVIRDAAHTGASGDGFVAVMPVERFDRLRNHAVEAPVASRRASASPVIATVVEAPSQGPTLAWLALVGALVSLAAVYFVPPQHRVHAFVVAIAMTLVYSLISSLRYRSDRS